MTPDKYDAIRPYLDDMSMILEEMLMEDTDNAKQVRYSLMEISKALGPDFTVDLNVVVQAFASRDQRALPLVELGVSATNGDTPYSHGADCTAQRYIVGGSIHVVPHDRCPKCWQPWMNKFENHTCEHCGTMLGRDCKVLLDRDTCPHCEEGRVSMRTPVCDVCGYEVDPKMVTWG